MKDAMDIPKYPDFKPIGIEDLSVFNRFFKDNPPEISEFTFTNLYAWRETYQLKAAILGGMLIVCSESEKQRRFFYPIGTGDTKSVMEDILKSGGGVFIRVPEAVKLLFENDTRFKIDLDMDNSDYLFKTADLAALAGRKYDGKRNLIKKFKSRYKYEYSELKAENAAECLEFEEEWCSIKDCASVEGLDNERRAFREMFKNFSFFELVAGAIKVEGKISAVAIGEDLNPNTLVMHILKANPKIEGLYQVINNEFLSRQAGNFEYVNLEQDLGVEGLRKSKLSYHPVKMVRKYTCVPNII